MASIGLAMVQGEKIANDLARDRVNTMANMASSAQTAEQAAQYFDPAAIAERQLLSQDKQEAVQNIADSKQYIKAMDLNPEQAVPVVLQKTMGGVPEDPNAKWTLSSNADGSYTARLVPSDSNSNAAEYRRIDFADKAQMQGALARNLTATSLETLKNINAREQASVLAHQKMAEDLYKAKNKYIYEINPETQSAERRTLTTAKYGLAGDQVRAAAGIKEAGIGAQATISSASIRAAAGIQEAYIGASAGASKAQLDAAMTKLRLSGINIDKDGNASFGGVPIEQLTPESATEMKNMVDDVFYTTGITPKYGLAPLTPTATIRGNVGLPPAKYRPGKAPARVPAPRSAVPGSSGAVHFGIGLDTPEASDMFTRAFSD